MYARAGNAATWPLCKYKIVSSTRASITVEMTPLRAEMPEKREESPPACLIAQRIQSLACCREHGRRVAAVIPPLAQCVSGNSGGQSSHATAGLARFAHRGCTASPESSNQRCSCATTSSFRERPSAALRVVLPPVDVHRARPLEAGHPVRREVVEPQVAHLQPRDLIDPQAGQGSHHRQQPSAVCS
jgi:hypothetical protein